LEIDDQELIRTAYLYLESLRMGSLQSAQSLLLGFTRRLRDNLLRHHAMLSNSCWITPPDILPDAAKVLSSANVQLCQSATEYIVSHLHADLSLKNLAKRFDVSTVHLNAVFVRARGITVMRFVTQMRLEAAKDLLATSPERVNDIAQLVGFASDASFCTVFQRQVGQSPGQYRKMMKQ
jgi:AraC-like DNA-binding protein